jgi:hypothetical protein
VREAPRFARLWTTYKAAHTGLGKV